MSEGLEGVAGLVEVGAVAVQSRSSMSEVDLAVEDGGVGVAVLVEVQYVCVYKVDPLVGGLCGSRGFLLNRTFLLGINGYESPEQEEK